MKIMERPVHQNLHILRQFTYSRSLKMATKLFLSLSIFSFFFSRSYFLSFFHSLNFCFSTFPYQLFTHTIDKNSMFLICNGLLVFLAKYSGLARSLSLSSHQDESRSKNLMESFQSELSMPHKKLELVATPENIGLEENVAMEEENEEESYLTNRGETEKEIVEDKELEKGSGSITLNEEEQEEEEEEEEIKTALVRDVEHEEENTWSKDEFLIDEEEEEEEEEDNEEVGNGMLSTEELNKKFDEFIRRMKEELRIEAKRQLIMV